MKKPKGFVLYAEQWDAVSDLSMTERGQVLTLLYQRIVGENVVLTDETISATARMAFKFIVARIESDHEKYLETTKQNRERKRRFDAKQKLTHDSQILSNASNARIRIESESETESESESNQNQNENQNQNQSSSQAAEGNSDVSEFGSAAWQRNFIAFFNRCVEGSNIPCIRTLTPKRIELLRRLREAIKANPGQMRTTEIVFKQAARSDFLNGRGRKNKFQATFDWLIKLENYIHVMEGNYP